MKKILILFGGNSPEHEISCMSVNFIKENIDTKLFNYKLVGIDFNNEWFEIDSNKRIDKNWKKHIIKKIDNIIEYSKTFDKVFPIIHGNTCEDGKLQSLFELYKINYVGCNSYSSLICYDKLLTKLILEKYDISQVDYYIYNNNFDINRVRFPVIIKPCKCGSSIGISVAKNKKEFIKAIKLAKKYDNNIIIEKYLSNKKELECAILKRKNKYYISDIGEIINENNWYDFDSKYKTKTETKLSNIDNILKNKIKNEAKNIFDILKCKDLSRLDFFYDLNSKKLYFNEINTIPGFTEISMWPKLINNLGISFKKMITILLDL